MRVKVKAPTRRKQKAGSEKGDFLNRQGVRESDIQIAFIAWVKSLPHPASNVTFAIANQSDAKISHYALKRRARMGLKAGTPDVYMAYPKKGHHGAFLELKTDSGKLNDSQITFHRLLEAQGYKVIVAYSLQQAIEEIREYLVI